MPRVYAEVEQAPRTPGCMANRQMGIDCDKRQGKGGVGIPLKLNRKPWDEAKLQIRPKVATQQNKRNGGEI
jgi:hypothetical protein